jgi:hypothetical protein
MRTIHKKLEIASNPHRNSAQSARAAGKKGHRHMAKALNPVKTAANHKKRPNAFKKKFEELKARKKHNRSRNPGMSEVVGRPADLVTTGASALGSAIATKQLPQLILQTGNTGWQGYLANAVTGGLATWAAGTFFGKTAAQGALAGALVIILDRVLTDEFSSLGPYLALSGVGDATSYGKLGTIRDGYYFHPSLYDANGNLITPQPVLSDAVTAVVNAYPQIAVPMATAMSQGGGGGKMGAAQPSALRRHMSNQMLTSNRFAGRFNR